MSFQCGTSRKQKPKTPKTNSKSPNTNKTSNTPNIGAGDNDLPVKGVVDLEFKVGKTKITMKRVVVVGIPLIVISTYALLEAGWKTVLGNAEESGWFLKKLKLPLKISERAWWLKVSLLSKHKSGVKGSGPAPMDLSTMNTGNTVNTDSTETKQTKRNTCCGCCSVAAVVPEDVVTKDLVTKGTKDPLTKDPVTHVATQEVAQVTKGRSGGSAQVKVKRRELQMKSADMLQSFSHVCRMFHFGSSRLFGMFLMNMSPIPVKQTFCLRQTLKQTMKRQTVKMILCHVVHLKRQTVRMIPSHVVMLQSFVKKIMAHLYTWSGRPWREDRFRSI